MVASFNLFKPLHIHLEKNGSTNIRSLQQLVSELFEETSSSNDTSHGWCEICESSNDTVVVKKTVLDSPPQLLAFEVIVINTSGEPTESCNLDISKSTIVLKFGDTPVSYHLKGFVTLKGSHYENFFVVDGLQDYLLRYHNQNCPSPVLVKRQAKYMVAVAIYGLQGEEEDTDDDAVLEFDVQTEGSRKKCIQYIDEQLTKPSPAKKSKNKKPTTNNTMTSSNTKLNQLKALLDKNNKKTKYFLPLIVELLFPKLTTRNFTLEEGAEGEGEEGEEMEE